MRILVTGVSGYVGAALVPRLLAAGHDVRGLTRDPARVPSDLGIDVSRGDVVSGQGLDAALDSADVAYYLIHSMESSSDGPFADRERRGAENFANAVRRAGVRRVVYLGGPVPASGPASAHLASRLAVEELLLEATSESVAFRASIVIGARSRSFRFLVRLVERMRVMPLPPWREHRTEPIDERDLLEYLTLAATESQLAGCSLDAAGPEILSYGEMIARIADLMLVGRPALRVGLHATSLAGPVAAAIAGEDAEFITPLMQSLGSNLLARDHELARLTGVRLHRFDAAVERSLRVWEESEPLAAR